MLWNKRGGGFYSGALLSLFIERSYGDIWICLNCSTFTLYSTHNGLNDCIIFPLLAQRERSPLYTVFVSIFGQWLLSLLWMCEFKRHTMDRKRCQSQWLFVSAQNKHLAVPERSQLGFYLGVWDPPGYHVMNQKRCNKSHTSISILHCSALIVWLCGALISKRVVLSQIAHCRFALTRSENVFLKNLFCFIVFYYFFNGELKTNGKDSEDDNW